MRRWIFIGCGALIFTSIAIGMVASFPPLSSDRSAYMVCGILGLITGALLGFGLHFLLRTDGERQADSEVQLHTAEGFDEVTRGTGGLVAGAVACVVAVIWFSVGIAGGRFYFYAPVLLVLGIASIFRSVGAKSNEE